MGNGGITQENVRNAEVVRDALRQAERVGNQRPQVVGKTNLAPQPPRQLSTGAFPLTSQTLPAPTSPPASPTSPADLSQFLNYLVTAPSPFVSASASAAMTGSAGSGGGGGPYSHGHGHARASSVPYAVSGYAAPVIGAPTTASYHVVSHDHSTTSNPAGPPTARPRSPATLTVPTTTATTPKVSSDFLIWPSHNTEPLAGSVQPPPQPVGHPPTLDATRRASEDATFRQRLRHLVVQEMEMDYADGDGEGDGEDADGDDAVEEYGGDDVAAASEQPRHKRKRSETKRDGPGGRGGGGSGTGSASMLEEPKTRKRQRSVDTRGGGQAGFRRVGVGA
ncbi:hypothetical protein HDU93_002649 [Gonapodya sp. JEL0774]|nr:hypothetical protein HDU93_002649 [Gonapodya sp. JEL0774]